MYFLPWRLPTFNFILSDFNRNVFLSSFKKCCIFRFDRKEMTVVIGQLFRQNFFSTSSWACFGITTEISISGNRVPDLDIFRKKWGKKSRRVGPENISSKIEFLSSRDVIGCTFSFWDWSSSFSILSLNPFDKDKPLFGSELWLCNLRNCTSRPVLQKPVITVNNSIRYVLFCIRISLY